METTRLRTPTKYPHIELDHKGRAVIAGTEYRVSMIVQDVFGANAYTPEKVAEQFPELAISQVHMALAYYHDHKAEVDRTIEAEHRFADEMRTRHHDPIREQKLIDAAKEAGLIAP